MMLRKKNYLCCQVSLCPCLGLKGGWGVGGGAGLAQLIERPTEKPREIVTRVHSSGAV